MTFTRQYRTSKLELVCEFVIAMAKGQHAVAENEEFTRAHFNRAFVLIQYFEYLRRNPNDAPDNNFDGYNFWLAKLDQFNGNFIEA